VSGAENVNELMIAALRAYVNMVSRRQIDAAFAGMAEDATFQAGARRIAEDFEESDWEALEAGEKASRRS
jgi:hypothetical protein